MLTLIINIPLVKAEPYEWTVDDDGGADFTKIQDAINAASPGDTIFVCNGTYYENVIVQNKERLTLVAESRENSVIDGNRTGNTFEISFCDDIELTGFTIQSSNLSDDKWWLSSGILLRQSENCIISYNNVEDNGFGIAMTGSKNVTVTGNIVENNSVRGIWFTNCASFTLRNNVISNNTYNFGVSAIYLQDFMHDIDISNEVNGKPIYYIVNGHDMQVPLDAGYVGVVNSTNIVVENLNLSNNVQGVNFAHTTNCTINNVNASENYIGMNIRCNSTGTTVTGNTIANNREGMGLRARNSTLRSNHILNCERSFSVAGWDLENFVHDIDTSNTVNGKPVRYIINEANVTIDGSMSVGYLGLVNCTNGLVKDQVITNNMGGLLLAYCSNFTIRNTTVLQCYHGIILQGSSNCDVINNFVTECIWGINIHTGERNRIYSNRVSDTSDSGLHIYSSNQNIFDGNTIESSAYCGINCRYSWNNTFYHNNIIGNRVQTYCYESSNIWDGGYPHGGNYWSDYADLDIYSGLYQNITGSDSIWDNPYVVDTENQDNYPLVEPWNATQTFNVTKDAEPYQISTFSNSKITDFQYNSTSNEISFNATGTTGTTGFCDMTIPKELGDTFEVLVDGIPVSYDQTQNATHYFLYFTYQHSTHAITITINPSPSKLIETLVGDIEQMNLKQGISNSLDAKLNGALAALEALKADKRSDAVNKLEAIINETEAQREKMLTYEQADYITSETFRIITIIEG